MGDITRGGARTASRRLRCPRHSEQLEVVVLTGADRIVCADTSVVDDRDALRRRGGIQQRPGNRRKRRHRNEEHAAGACEDISGEHRERWDPLLYVLGATTTVRGSPLATAGGHGIMQEAMYSREKFADRL